MPRVLDFRLYSFQPNRIARCGRKIGRDVYWKLYVIENTIRIVIHSVLTAQINANWWSAAVDQRIVGNAGCPTLLSLPVLKVWVPRPCAFCKGGRDAADTMDLQRTDGTFPLFKTGGKLERKA